MVALCLSCLRQLSWLCSCKGGWGSLCFWLTWAKLPLGCWQHPSHSLGCVLIIFYSQTYTHSSQQHPKAPSLSYREKRRLQLKSCLCAGVSTGLAAYRTGKTLRSRQAPPACLHYKLKHPDRNFHSYFKLLHWGVPWGKHQCVRMALDRAVLHKWMANAQTKMPTKIFTLGARLLGPILGSWLTGNSRLRALHPPTSTESVTLPPYQKSFTDTKEYSCWESQCIEPSGSLLKWGEKGIGTPHVLLWNYQLFDWHFIL